MNIEIETLCEGTKVANLFDVSISISPEKFEAHILDINDDISTYEISGEQWKELDSMFKEHREKQN